MSNVRPDPMGFFWTTATCASKLIEESLLAAVFGSNNMWAHFPDVTFICGDDLLLVCDGIADSVIRVTH